MKQVTLYVCEICGTEWRDKDLAARCEARGTPAKKVPWEIGGEVKLKNRNKGYTLAVVKGARVANFSDLAHEWMLELDRQVYLDHAWDDQTDQVFELYVLSPERAAGMERMDNHSD